jgi:ABC-2 type transport system ATP-binding protein
MTESVRDRMPVVDTGSMLRVHDVTARAGARTLLEGVGFEAVPGEIVAIIGPNGAGKTTLLETIVGLRRASTETVTLGGKSLQTFDERARAFAYLPDAAELAAELHVGELVEHTLRFRPRTGPLVDELRSVLRIGDLVDTPSGVLSRGERQRVALFCALAVERPVVVLDEPFSAFDPLQLGEVLGAVRHVSDAGAVVITSVHQLGDAEKVADRVLLLADGRRVAWGTLDSFRSEANLPGATLEAVFIALLERRAHAS